jgi:hypothetical protein
MKRDMFFLVSVSLCLLMGFIALSRLSVSLPRVYVNPHYGQPVFGGQPGPDRVVTCVGLPHLDTAGFLICGGELIYHPYAYNVPIDDREFIAEIQAMKRAIRSR